MRAAELLVRFSTANWSSDAAKFSKQGGGCPDAALTLESGAKVQHGFEAASLLRPGMRFFFSVSRRTWNIVSHRIRRSMQQPLCLLVCPELPVASRSKPVTAVAIYLQFWSAIRSPKDSGEAKVNRIWCGGCKFARAVSLNAVPSNRKPNSFNVSGRSCRNANRSPCDGELRGVLRTETLYRRWAGFRDESGRRSSPRTSRGCRRRCLERTLPS